MSSSPGVVMKFGGTSVQDAEAISRAAEIVRSRLDQRPIVVVSALSGVTDSLLRAARASGSGERDRALEIARAIRERHYIVAGELLSSATFAPIHEELSTDFDQLEHLLRGIAAVGELTPRSADAVLSFGERLSSRIVTEALCARRLPAAHADSRTLVITDNHFGRAVPDTDAIERACRQSLIPLVADHHVPVMAGFIGATPQGIATTLGRGGSDFTAAVIGAAVNAQLIEIWTDVDGMMTTDPRLCPDARRIRVISFEEAAELAYFGAKVLHPATLLSAVQKNIPVAILNSRNPSCEGTRILARTPASREPLKAIAVKKSITIVDIVATRMLMAHGFLESIFSVFARHRCPVDMVSTSEVSVSVTVDSNEAIPAIAAELEKLADVKYEGRKAIICLVGENIRAATGLAAKVFTAI